MTVGNEYYPSAYRRLRNGDAILVEVELEQRIRTTASKYHSVISRANALGHALSCYATVEDVGGLTVRLHLAWPEGLGRWLDLPAGPA